MYKQTDEGRQPAEAAEELKVFQSRNWKCNMYCRFNLDHRVCGESDIFLSSARDFSLNVSEKMLRLKKKPFLLVSRCDMKRTFVQQWKVFCQAWWQRHRKHLQLSTFEQVPKSLLWVHEQLMPGWNFDRARVGLGYYQKRNLNTDAQVERQLAECSKSIGLLL